jgi:peptide/nickel transport system substrate-binding protein
MRGPRPRLVRSATRFLLAGTALAAAACGPPLDPAETLTVAIDNSPASLDPRIGSDEASKRASDLLYNGLFRLDDAARPAPDLAASWRAPDPRTIIVTLRRGVRFHDGSPLSARDVRYTYLSILGDEVPSFRKADLAALESIAIQDEGTVVFHLRQPFAPILTNLNVPILKEGAGPGAARRPVGTGPFRLVRYRKDEDLLLERFDGHFQGPGAVRWLRLKIIPSETARFLELLKGGVDLIVNDLSPDQILRLRRTEGFRVETRPGRNYVYMGFNCVDPILSDRRVREAIARALDRREIVRHLLRGTATLASGMLPPDHWAYAADVARYEPDPSAADRLLREAGHPDPDGSGPDIRFRLTYKTSTSELALQQAAIIQQQLARVGIGIDVRAYEWPTFYEDLKAGRFQMVVSMWTEINDPDVLRLRFHSRYRPPAGSNRGGYDNPEVDRLIEEGAATLEEPARRAIYARAQRLLAADLPYVSLWHRDVVVARRARVRNFRLTPGADFSVLREVTLDRGDAPGAALPEKGSARALEEKGALVGPAAEHLADRRDRHRPGPDKARRVGRQIEHRRGESAVGLAAVEDQGQRVSERLLDFGRRLGRRLPRKVGAGGDDGHSGDARQGGGDRVRRDPHSDGMASSQQAGWKARRGRQDQGESAGPEGGGEAPRALGEFPDAEHDRRFVGGDERQGHALGSALRLEHLVHRLRAARVGPQPVEGLGRVGHQLAGADELRGSEDQPGIGVMRVDALHPLHVAVLPVSGRYDSTITDPGRGGVMAGASRRASRQGPA